jgi:hypothetical protein
VGGMQSMVGWQTLVLSWKGREVSVSARVSEVPATYQQGTWHGHYTMRPRLIYCKIVLCTAGVVSL